MMSFSAFGRGLRFAVVIALALFAAACAQNRQQDPNAAAGAGGPATPGSAQDFVVNVGDRVFFLVDQTTLTPQAMETLNRQAQWLNQYAQYQITIEGHADERGTREYNLGLSARRGNVVRDYLASRGVNPGRLRVVSYGKERPVAVCDDESCWSQNRRAVTVVGGAGA